jgi:ribonuclease P protein component
MAKRFTLGKTERLKSRKAIGELFEKGNNFSISPFRVLYQQTAIEGLQVAVGVSSKNFKRAVDRNRIKRQIREAYRLEKIPLQQLLRSRKKGMRIFLTYTGKAMPEYAAVLAIVGKCLNKLLKQLNEMSPGDGSQEPG